MSNMFTFPRHDLATSALPNAPVIDDEPERGALRIAFAAALRRTATGIRRLADRIEPTGSRAPVGP